MAQFKYVGHLHGAMAPKSTGLIKVSGLKGDSPVAEKFEMQVEPGEVFEIPDDWTTAIRCLEAHRHPFKRAVSLYERIA